MKISFRLPFPFNLRSFTSHLINPSFYNFFDRKTTKEPDSLTKIISEISDLFKVKKDAIFPLQYNDPGTKNFSQFSRVYLLKSKGIPLKIRYASGKREAKKLFYRASFAKSLGVLMSDPIEVRGRYVSFSYIPGKNATNANTSSMIKQIAFAQSLLNSAKITPKATKIVQDLTSKMILKCLDYLSKKKISKSILKGLESKLIGKKFLASFDHQDYGIHNLVINEDSKICIIDEEAFGLIPLGYGVIQPIYGENNYSIISGNKRDFKKYLIFFEQQDVIMHYLNSMRALFILRNSVRKFMVRNDLGAHRLLAQWNMLI